MQFLKPVQVAVARTQEGVKEAVLARERRRDSALENNNLFLHRRLASDCVFPTSLSASRVVDVVDLCGSDGARERMCVNVVSPPKRMPFLPAIMSVFAGMI